MTGLLKLFLESFFDHLFFPVDVEDVDEFVGLEAVDNDAKCPSTPWDKHL